MGMHECHGESGDCKIAERRRGRRRGEVRSRGAHGDKKGEKHRGRRDLMELEGVDLEKHCENPASEYWLRSGGKVAFDIESDAFPKHRSIFKMNRMEFKVMEGHGFNVVVIDPLTLKVVYSTTYNLS